MENMDKKIHSQESNEKMKFVPVRVFSTGGTIDSSPDYDPTKKSVFQGTYLPQMFAQARLPTEAVIEPIMQKDSMDLTAEDRQLMLDRCMQSPDDRILITHGTDTLSETAKFLGEKGVGNKTVVLVGSFVPLSQPNSDAHFNLGFSMAAAQLLPAGVWIAINGEVFEWDNVQKNRDKARFERIK
ncbi:MAG: asparaginase domain-containing protein [bacterium]|nr:asparaginase domain-containing protein [bacterium]